MLWTFDYVFQMAPGATMQNSNGQVVRLTNGDVFDREARLFAADGSVLELHYSYDDGYPADVSDLSEAPTTADMGRLAQNLARAWQG